MHGISELGRFELCELHSISVSGGCLGAKLET